MAATQQRDLTRLEVLRQGNARLHVDRAFPGRIRGASIVTTGPALGHGFQIDRTTAEQVTEFAAGTRGRWTHGGLSDDGLGRHLGTWEDVHLESFHLCRSCNAETQGPACPTCGSEASLEHRAVGDFAFASSAHKIRPDGLDVPAPVYLMERAEEDPQSLGISIVGHFGYYEPPVKEGQKAQRFARLESKKDLKRGDWVADPAANPVGLHEGTATPSELTEAAARQLDRIVERLGTEEAEHRALSFLERYFDSRAGRGPAPRPAVPEPQPDDRVSALEARLTEQAQELAALKSVLQSYEAAEELRVEDEASTYLEQLAQESAELNAPIPAVDLARVEGLLKAGELETAKVVGQAFLERSRAQGQTAFTRETETPLASKEERHKASAEARASMLRRRGWHVELNPEGTQVVRATPPQQGG